MIMIKKIEKLRPCLSLLEGDCAFTRQIGFISNQKFVHIFAGISVETIL